MSGDGRARLNPHPPALTRGPLPPPEGEGLDE